MFKKGFTLQELLITLGIIGIVAAITGPAIVGLAPDKSKTMYMKAYNTLLNVTSEIMDDPSLYFPTYSAAGELICSGLYCAEHPNVEPYNSDDFRGITKYPRIFASKLNIIEDPEAEELGGGRSSEVTFTTIDGVNWEFTTYDGHETPLPDGPNIEQTPGRSYYYSVVKINVNPDDNGNACEYGTDCTSPNIFTFLVDNDGGVKAIDPLGMVFLQNPTDMHATKDDRNLAAEILDESNLAVKDYQPANYAQLSNAFTKLKKEKEKSKT